MNELGTVGWSALSAAIALQISIIGVVVRLLDRISKAKEKADAAETAAQNATLANTALKIEMERVEADLVSHRVDTAKEYVSKGTLENLENRIVDAINRLGDRLDKLLATH